MDETVKFADLPQVRELRKQNIAIEKQISELYARIEQLKTDLRGNNYALDDLWEVFEEEL